jgi:uroporphyrinogen-III synthase
MRVLETVGSSATNSLGVLTGCCVAVTRATRQAGPLIAGIEQLGGRVFLFPTLLIEQVIDAGVEAKLASFSNAHMLIFVSPNAVLHGLSLTRARADWPKLATIAAVGCSTATILEEQRLRVDLVPELGSGAAALLELQAFQGAEIVGRRVFIFKGRGGLALLADELALRGAVVEEVDVYERRVPEVDPGLFLATARRGGIDVIVITSAQALVNLFEMVGIAGRQWLCRAELVVVSERIADVALDLGTVRRPSVAKGATLRHVLSELTRWKESKHGGQEGPH